MLSLSPLQFELGGAQEFEGDGDGFGVALPVGT
jgi:hypothetical protein